MSLEMIIKQDEVKKEILNYFNMVDREGFQTFVESLDEMGYFLAPASTTHHLNYEGGLAEHSLNVLKCIIELNISLKAELPLESLIISALCHDIGKAKFFDKPEYLPNILKSGKISDAKPYEKNKTRPPIDHEIAALPILQKYFQLTEDEMTAILYHNGLYTLLGRSIQGKETKLYMLLHWADMWASHVIEIENNEVEDDTV